MTEAELIYRQALQTIARTPLPLGPLEVPAATQCNYLKQVASEALAAAKVKP